MTLGPSRLPKAGPPAMTPTEGAATAVDADDATPAAEDDDDEDEDDEEDDGDATSGNDLRMAETCACAGVSGVTKAARVDSARRCAGVSVASTRRTLRGGGCCC